MLNGDRLGQLIWQQVQAVSDKTNTLAFWQLVGNAIVQEVITNGVILPTTMTSPTGPVTGTGKIQ